MGLFSGLKNFLTGGAAELRLEPMEIKVGQTSAVRVKVLVKDSDVKSKELYLYLRSEVTCNDYKVEWKDKNEDKKFDKIEITSQRITTTVKQEKFTLDQSPLYRKGSDVLVEKGIQIPNDMSPSISGMLQWKALAGIDASGNDPDSGWSDVNILLPEGQANFGTWFSLIPCRMEQRVFQFHIRGTFAYSVMDLEKLREKFGNLLPGKYDGINMYLGNLIGASLTDIISKSLPKKESPIAQLNGPKLLEMLKSANPAEFKGGLELNYLDITEIIQMEQLENN